MCIHIYSVNIRVVKLYDKVPTAGPVVIHWTLVASLLCGDSGLRLLEESAGETIWRYSPFPMADTIGY